MMLQSIENVLAQMCPKSASEIQQNPNQTSLHDENKTNLHFNPRLPNFNGFVLVINANRMDMTDRELIVNVALDQTCFPDTYKFSYEMGSGLGFLQQLVQKN